MAALNTKGIAQEIRRLIQSKDFEDRAGRTQLERLAEQVAASGPTGGPALKAAEAVQLLLQETPAMGADEVRRLVYFISAANLPAHVFNDALDRLLSEALIEPSDAQKRAELLRLHLHLGRRFLPAELEIETGVREAAPWVWFDLMLPTSVEKAGAFACERLRTYGLEPALVARIVEVWRRLGQGFPPFFASLKCCLPKEDAKILRETLSDYEIDLPLDCKGQESAATAQDDATIRDFAKTLSDLKSNMLLAHEVIPA